MENSSEENLAELLTLRKVLEFDNSICYYNSNNQLHRIHGPAVEWPNGFKEWWEYGKFIRTEYIRTSLADGTKEWYINGVRHRIDGPAAVHHDGEKQWWEHGKLHRIDGPAVEYSSGVKDWYEHGKFIRRELS